MRVINIVRYIILTKLLFFSLVALALSGHIMSQYGSDATIPVYLPLNLAVGVITIVVVLISLIVNIFRKGAFTSMIAVEIGWVSVLMVLWVAAAGETTASLGGENCGIFVVEEDGFFDENVITPFARALCGEAHAVEAFVWFNWIGTLVWMIYIITMSAVSHSRGNSKVWTSPVTSAWDASTGNATNNAAPHAQHYKTQDPYAAQPMVQQHSGYSQGYPPQQQQYGYNAVPPPAQSYGYNGAAQV